MPPIQPPSPRPEAAAAGAARLMRVFDQTRTEKRFDDERSIPPDGKLHRDELPIAAFGAIDRLETADGAIDEAELARALARLSAADQRLLDAEVQASTERLEGVGKRYLMGFGAFAGGGLALVGGLALAGPVGLGLAALGAAGLATGVGTAIWTFVTAGREGRALVGKLDGIFARAAL